MEETKVHAYAPRNVGPQRNEFSVTMLSSKDYATPHGLTAHNYSTIEEAEAAFFQAYPDGFWHDTQESFYTVVNNRYLDRITAFIKQYRIRQHLVDNLRYQHMQLFDVVWPKDEPKPSEEVMNQRIAELRRASVGFAGQNVG